MLLPFNGLFFFYALMALWLPRQRHLLDRTGIEPDDLLAAIIGLGAFMQTHWFWLFPLGALLLALPLVLFRDRAALVLRLNVALCALLVLACLLLWMTVEGRMAELVPPS